MTKVQSAWVAGIVEGEGCISVGHVKNWSRTSVQVNMTDFDVIARLQRWTKLGSVHMNRPLPDRKQSWTWSVNRQAEVKELLTLIFPFLCGRRQAKALLALELLEGKEENGGLGRGRQHRAKSRCRNGHAFSKENTYIDNRGCRKCRTCKREAVKKWEAQDPEGAKRLHRDATRRFRQRAKQTPQVGGPS